MPSNRIIQRFLIPKKNASIRHQACEEDVPQGDPLTYLWQHRKNFRPKVYKVKNGGGGGKQHHQHVSGRSNIMVPGGQMIVACSKFWPESRPARFVSDAIYRALSTL